VGIYHGSSPAKARSITALGRLDSGEAGCRLDGRERGRFPQPKRHRLSERVEPDRGSVGETLQTAFVVGFEVATSTLSEACRSP
jgi:hypothetical protein